MSTGIAIVFPAWFLGSTDTTLHCTALFLGDTETTAYSRADIEHVLRWKGADPGPVRVTGTELFGRDKNVPVLTIESAKVMQEYEWLAGQLRSYGITSASEFGFNPHVTIAKEEAKPYFPKYVQLEAPVLWWGSDRPIHSKHGQLLTV